MKRNSKINIFLSDQGKNNFAQFGGLQKLKEKFSSNFLFGLFFGVKRYWQLFNKNHFKVCECLNIKTLLSAHGQTCRFFRNGTFKNIPVWQQCARFQKSKKMLYHSMHAPVQSSLMNRKGTEGKGL